MVYNSVGWRCSQPECSRVSSMQRCNRKKGNGSRFRRMKESEAGVSTKRVVVLVDCSSSAMDAVMWALTHVISRGDLLTLLQVISSHGDYKRPFFTDPSSHLAQSLASLCKERRPEVDVEALVVRGPRLTTVLSQVKKLQASVLVLGQSKPCLFSCLISSRRDEFIEQCINNADCLTMAVRKRSGTFGGYFISTKSQKNFWLLA